jgi:hypothetical protein
MVYKYVLPHRNTERGTVITIRLKIHFPKHKSQEPRTKTPNPNKYQYKAPKIKNQDPKKHQSKYKAPNKYQYKHQNTRTKNQIKTNTKLQNLRFVFCDFFWFLLFGSWNFLFSGLYSVAV